MAVRPTGDEQADALLNRSPLALLLGMMLDQQIPIERAFAGPAELERRIGVFDAPRLAAMEEDDLVDAFCAKPALHRFPAVMAKRARAICTLLVEEYGGDPSALWADVDDAAELTRRLRQLPGFGANSTRIFIALLAKRFEVCPPGWEAEAGQYSEPGLRSVADLDSTEALAALRAQRKAAATTKGATS